MAGRERDRDGELLLPVIAGEHVAVADEDSEPTTPVILESPARPASSVRGHHLHHHHPTGIEVIHLHAIFVQLFFGTIYYDARIARFIVAQAFSMVIRSWAWKKFMSGWCARAATYI
jgi:hypothetical protein